MSPEAIRAVAYLLGEALNMGASFKAIMDEVDQTGKVSPEMWARIRSEIDRADARWEEAGND